ncbi:MAG: adenosylmethionine--8-amino-7-oxononanoate transaminase [Candidatus Delongbacteria bacterium]|nr:adenosylmethionine--8-amino-7-oxononanoate transaminase [Candidatus Delongbacteria bacterium]MBN2836014.1 adenosylmethionine--8-amino-7-oxononanoate transaminase [Candidatus Delongbacteria bacterium]
MDYNFDKEFIWHPYTSLKNPTLVYGVSRGYEDKIVLDDGRIVIDGMSSWWSVVHGYNNSYINNALKSQIDNLSHVMFGGMTHKPAIDLAKKLQKMLPGDLDYTFFADSGSVSVEVAMKMAIQYHYSKGHSKAKFFTVRSGYHGDTYHAMSVCDPENGMHRIFSKTLPLQIFTSDLKVKPDDDWNDSHFDNILKEILALKNDIAGIIIEPIVQGAGGMKFYHPEFLRHFRTICDELDIVLIFDEIATGFGRSGKMFAMEHASVIPDIVTLGKALTGGYMTLAAVVCNKKIRNGISDGSFPVLMHGPTFMANPLACSAANASLDLINSYNFDKISKRVNKYLLEPMKVLLDNKVVKDVRGFGAIAVVEMKRNVEMTIITRELIKRGVWLRPFGKLIYSMPTYISDEKSLQNISDAIIDIINRGLF